MRVRAGETIFSCEFARIGSDGDKGHAVASGCCQITLAITKEEALAGRKGEFLKEPFERLGFGPVTAALDAIQQAIEAVSMERFLQFCQRGVGKGDTRDPPASEGCQDLPASFLQMGVEHRQPPELLEPVPSQSKFTLPKGEPDQLLLDGPDLGATVNTRELEIKAHDLLLQPAVAAKSLRHSLGVGPVGIDQHPIDIKKTDPDLKMCNHLCPVIFLEVVSPSLQLPVSNLPK